MSFTNYNTDSVVKHYPCPMNDEIPTGLFLERQKEIEKLLLISVKAMRTEPKSCQEKRILAAMLDKPTASYCRHRRGFKGRPGTSQKRVLRRLYNIHCLISNQNHGRKEQATSTIMPFLSLCCREQSAPAEVQLKRGHGCIISVCQRPSKRID